MLPADLELGIDSADLEVAIAPHDLRLGLLAQEVLNSTVRPLLNVDAGDAEIESVVDGHVTIRLLGACSRCAFRQSCAAYVVLDRLEASVDARASFSVAGVAVNREAAQLNGRPAPRYAADEGPAERPTAPSGSARR